MICELFSLGEISKTQYRCRCGHTGQGDFFIVNLCNYSHKLICLCKAHKGTRFLPAGTTSLLGLKTLAQMLGVELSGRALAKQT